MKKCIHFFCFLLTAFFSHTELKAQIAAEVTEGFDYQVVVQQDSSDINQITFDADFSIPKSQFVAGKILSLTLKDGSGNVVFEFVAGPDLVSGARVDASKVFTSNHDDFIFHLKNIACRSYDFFMQVIQDDGDSFKIQKSIDLCALEEGGKP